MLLGLLGATAVGVTLWQTGLLGEAGGEDAAVAREKAFNASAEAAARGSEFLFTRYSVHVDQRRCWATHSIRQYPSSASAVAAACEEESYASGTCPQGTAQCVHHQVVHILACSLASRSLCIRHCTEFKHPVF